LRQSPLLLVFYYRWYRFFILPVLGKFIKNCILLVGTNQTLSFSKLNAGSFKQHRRHLFRVKLQFAIVVSKLNSFPVRGQFDNNFSLANHFGFIAFVDTPYLINSNILN